MLRSATPLLLAVAVAFLAASTASAFATQRSGIASRPFSRSSSPSTRVSAAEVSDDAPPAYDPFESYAAGDTELAIKDVVVGDGDEAKVGDVVTVKYEGRLLESGKMFDAGTFAFKLGSGRVIPGWDKGIEGCRVGGKRVLRIPPGLAYGTNGAADVIPPNADLEFDCEVTNVANGPVAEFAAALGLGLNLRTFALVGFALTIILPRLGLMEKGFI